MTRRKVLVKLRAGTCTPANVYQPSHQRKLLHPRHVVCVRIDAMLPNRNTETGTQLRYRGAFGSSIRAGLLGSLIVSGWFSTTDAFSGELFSTPTILGQAIFSDAFRSSAALIVTYFLLQTTVFVWLGGIAYTLIKLAGRQRFMVFPVFLLLVVVSASLVIGALTVTSRTALEEIAQWKILLGAALGVLGMILYLSRVVRIFSRTVLVDPRVTSR